jgi:phosphonopyruvate decarboxylase
MIQNSGLGNAVSPLTSLTHVFRIPLLLIVTLRGEVGSADEPQHRLMGEITERLLGLMEIPFSYFPQRSNELHSCLDAAIEHLGTHQTPYALIMRKNTLAPHSLLERNEIRRPAEREQVRKQTFARASVQRSEAISTIVSAAGDDALLLATTGLTARELCDGHDRDGNFYVVGSMGCASSIGLGLALCRPERSVVVLDGDGAALMRLEAMASIGHYGPRNLTHIVLDNQSYESTGGQKTQSASIDLAGVATACGYRTAGSLSTIEQLWEAVTEARTTAGPHLVHFRIRAGSPPDLGRPAMPPPALAARFRAAACSSAVPVGVLV